MKSLIERHRRILGETAWVFAGQAASVLATLVGLRLITEFVPPPVYGTVALALGIVALAQGLTVGPLMQAVLRFYPDQDACAGEVHLRRAARSALRKPLLLALSALSMGGGITAMLRPQHLALVLFGLVLFLIETVRSIEITFLNAARRQRALALLVTADAWLRPFDAVMLVWLWGPHPALIIGGYALGAAMALALYWGLAQPLRGSQSAPGPPQRTTEEVAQRLQAYAWPLTALPLIGWVIGQADRYLIGGMAGIEAAGLYAALYGLASKPFLMLSSSIELALRQPFYSRVSAGDRRGARAAVTVWLAGTVGLALLCFLMFVAFHADIARMLLAAEYRNRAALMGWIAAGYVLLAAAQVLERVCYAHHDTRGVLFVEAVGALLSVIIAAPLVFRYGVDGAAWAVPAYFGAQLVLTLARANRVWRLASWRDTLLAAPGVAPRMP